MPDTASLAPPAVPPAISKARRRSLKFFLWLSAFGWAIGLGAKVFDLVVLGMAWGRSPPESLALLPYGRSFPVDPGNFFQPVSALLLIGLIGAFIAGWPLRDLRRCLFAVAGALALIWILTPTVFWPMIIELWETSRGRQSHPTTELQALIHRWFLFDSARIVCIAIGFVGIVQALIVAAVRTPNER